MLPTSPVSLLDILLTRFTVGLSSSLYTLVVGPLLRRLLSFRPSDRWLITVHNGVPFLFVSGRNVGVRRVYEPLCDPPSFTRFTVREREKR